MQWLALLIGFYIFLLPSFAQPTKWQNLAQRIDSLYEHAYYRDAIPLVQEVVIEAEKTFGRQHANFSASINMLGRLYQMQAKFDLAESLLTRSLQIDQEHSDNNDTIFIQHTLDLVEFFDTRCLYSKAE